ncbi:hypothetical protein [Spongiivirga citrea]|uniref:Uncharacterized protein n=1 Tax=Spongiivirga citrea TaxID=1481457 RepID=A0A6M0CIB9_9FLAO|nr:hypothetical protein [Spongiivirga citrea]NER17645.1 hypothetical protein [Spongiivirga citrea]
MERFKKLHLWMLLPLVLMQVGIFNYYWPTFSSETWEIHIHFWLVTLWSFLLIIQPYLATTGKIANHRTVGIIGFLLAGGVIFTGFSLLDFPLRLMEKLDPSSPGPPVAFYYGTLVVEAILMLAFAYAVLKSIVQRKELQNHSWWLICSIFYMMMPALGRGMIVFWRSILPPDKFNPMIVFVSAEVIYIPLFVLFVYKFGKFKHLATIIGFFLVIVRVLRVPIGSSEMVQEFLKVLIRF